VYQFSTDYEDLFRLLCSGEIAVGFVDYRFDHNTENPPMRDVVKIERHGPGQIFIGARGVAYGSINPFMCKGQEEVAVFAGICSTINLAWVPAQVTHDASTHREMVLHEEIAVLQDRVAELQSAHVSALNDLASCQAVNREIDRQFDETLTQREAYHKWADKLADAIATHLEEDIGEHSSANNPWANALEFIGNSRCR